MNNKELKELKKISKEIRDTFIETMKENIKTMFGSKMFDVDRAIMKFEKWIEEHSQD